MLTMTFHFFNFSLEHTWDWFININTSRLL